MRPDDLPILTPVVTHLLRMRQALIDRPDHRFDMGYWQKEKYYGSVCCLLGSYIEAYGDETGLELRGNNVIPIDDSVYTREDIPTEHIACVLGMTAEDSYQLFVPTTYPMSDKRTVLARLDEMIEKYSNV